MRDTTIADIIGRNRPFIEAMLKMSASQLALLALREIDMLMDMAAQIISAARNRVIMIQIFLRRIL
ncbi:hypothetical protein D3C74_491330 [compost metagenome]